ncbi:MAG TPA: hypothetical protein VGR06_10680 [Actinophytocola sp.]|uniref:hypothetical protein n=1 Tax=Actinophytocola sp. TaxID=1872138 RepID=UPI002DF80539|nr:hypothetical protein [Actinophytocola sp.]
MRQKLDPADQAAVRSAIEAMDCAAPDPLRLHDDPALPLVACDRRNTCWTRHSSPATTWLAPTRRSTAPAAEAGS